MFKKTDSKAVQNHTNILHIECFDFRQLKGEFNIPHCQENCILVIDTEKKKEKKWNARAETNKNNNWKHNTAMM